MPKANIYFDRVEYKGKDAILYWKDALTEDIYQARFTADLKRTLDTDLFKIAKKDGKWRTMDQDKPKWAKLIADTIKHIRTTDKPEPVVTTEMMTGLGWKGK